MESAIGAATRKSNEMDRAGLEDATVSKCLGFDLMDAFIERYAQQCPASIAPDYVRFF